MEATPTIVCVDCGGRAHLITFLPPDEEPEPDMVLTYRCADCGDRWDIVVGEDEAEEKVY